MEYVQRRFSEIPSLGGVARNRGLSNNGRCNNLAANVPRDNSNVANNDKINLEKKEARRETRDLAKYGILDGFPMIFTYDPK